MSEKLFDSDYPVALVDLNFALKTDDLTWYLKKIHPGGYRCPVCGVDDWTRLNTEVGGVAGVPDGWYDLPANLSGKELGEINVIATQLRENWSQGSAELKRELVDRIKKLEYRYWCRSCAHSLSFNAMTVASRVRMRGAVDE